MSEGEHRPVRERAHRGHGRVVGVEYGGAARREALHQFAFRRGYRLAGAEVAQVGLADVEHDRDIGRDEFGERRDVAHPARPHFQSEAARLGVRAEHGDRHAEFVVHRPGRGDRGRGARQDGSHQVLRARLALRAGDADDRQSGAQAGDDVRGECLQRGLGVRDDDRGQCRGARAEYGHRPRLACLRGVVVAVDVFAVEGDEEPARLGPAAVEDGRGRHRDVVARDRAAGDRGDLGEAERDHAGTSLDSFLHMGSVKAARGYRSVCGFRYARDRRVSRAYRNRHTLS
jgi:hypothetical protein